jgi:threonine dehydratase
MGEQREARGCIFRRSRAASGTCRALGNRGIPSSITAADASRAHVFAGVQLQDGEHERHALIMELRDQGYPIEDLTDRRLPSCIRHMVAVAPG